MILEQEIAPPELSTETVPGTARRIRVLLVEDDPDSAELQRTLLTVNSADPFEVEWCSNLTTAMIKLAEPNFDVVLLDLGLPELSGYTSLRASELVAADCIPIVILTADESKVTRDLTVGYGSAPRNPAKPHAVAYLVKGRTSGDELRRTVRAAVQGFRPNRGMN